MHNSNKFNSCKICGYYESGWFPWGVDGRTPSFDICPQCNVQFGYEDCNDEAIKSYRKVYEEMIKYDQKRVKGFFLDPDVRIAVGYELMPEVKECQ